MCSPTVEGQGRHSPVGLVGAVDAAVVAHAHVRGAGVVAHVTPEQPLRRAPASCWTKPLLTELHPAWESSQIIISSQLNYETRIYILKE